jgi:tetratricopeptide (TPR) repeat protein
MNWTFPRPTIALAAMVVLSAASSVAGAPVAPQRGWRQISTPNFRVVGNAGDGDLRRAATRLEQFREALGILFPKAVLVSSVPTTVIVFKGDREYEPFKPLYRGKVKDIAGLFMPGRAGNYVTLASSGIEQFGAIVYHEYVHLVVNNTLERVPLWFNEGLAEYYATFEVTGGGAQASLGKVQAHHVLRLREQWLPLETLLAVGYDSPQYNEGDKMSVFYAESWALVHYLLLGHEGTYTRGVGPFVADLANGVPVAAACQKAFGLGPAALERELRRYVEGERFLRQVVRFTNRIGAIDQVAATPVEEASVHAVLGDVLLRLRRQDEARAQLEAAFALSPEQAEAHAVMGRLLLDTGDKATATTHLAKASASASASWSSQYEYANLLLEARGAGGPDRDDEIERALRRTIELQPSFPDAYVQLGALRSRTPGGAEEGIGLVKKALALAPGNEHYWLYLAGLHATNHDYASTKAIAARLASARDAGVRSEAATLLAGANQMLAYEKRSPVTSPGSASSDTPSEGARAAGVMPIFRTQGTGEERIAGALTEIRCASATARISPGRSRAARRRTPSSS